MRENRTQGSVRGRSGNWLVYLYTVQKIMDINSDGIILLWLALLWPMAAVSLFVKSKLDAVRGNTVFFAISFFVAYLLGYIFCYSLTYSASFFAERTESILGLTDVNVSFTPYMVGTLIIGMPIAINYFVYEIYLKFKKGK